MEDGSDFESTVNFKDILNDAELNAELLSLGWSEQPISKLSDPLIKLEVPLTAAANSIDEIGLFDDTNVVLEESDLQDEELLLQFERLQNGSHQLESVKLEPSLTNVTIVDMLRPALHSVQSNSSGNLTIAEAKKMAIKYKREGNNNEALKWLRYSKQIENNEEAVLSDSIIPDSLTKKGSSNNSRSKATSSLSTSSTIKKTTVNQPRPQAQIQQKSVPLSQTPSLSPPNRFTALENAILEAANLALKEAKFNEKIDAKLALTKMREYKALQQELNVLNSRKQIPYAESALFQWEIVKKEVVVENMDLAEDEIKVIIEGAYEIAGTIKESNNNINIGLGYNLGISKEETALIMVPPVKYDNGTVQFSYQAILPILKRGKHAVQQYSRKKAIFDLTLVRKGGGFLFWSAADKSETLCSAVLPLNDLLNKSSCGGALPLKTAATPGSANSSNSSNKRSKIVGGYLQVKLVIRSPLLGPEVVIKEERKLIIGPWPNIIAGGNNNNNSCFLETMGSTAFDKSEAELDSIVVPLNDQTTVVVLANTIVQCNDNDGSSKAKEGNSNSYASQLTKKEMDDPHSVDNIESNDVLEQEILDATAAAGKLKNDGGEYDDNDSFSINLRLQLLQTKLQLLVYQVQNEIISLDQYLEVLRARVKKDQIMALYFKSVADSARQDAVADNRRENNNDSDTIIADNTAHALRIMRRVQIMKQEIKTAEDSCNE